MRRNISVDECPGDADTNTDDTMSERYSIQYFD